MNNFINIKNINIYINLISLLLLLSLSILTLFEANFAYFESTIIIFLLFNFIIKISSWLKNNKYNVKFKINNYDIIFNNRFVLFIVLILSNINPLYMTLQKPYLIVDLVTIKILFFIVFILALLGFIIEFFVGKNSERTSND